LALTNIREQFENQVVDEAARELAKNEYWFGSKSIKRGNSNSISYSVSMKELFENDKEKANERGFKINKGGFTCTYSYNPSSPKEGKMDV
jgi:hypothetical protein